MVTPAIAMKALDNGMKNQFTLTLEEVVNSWSTTGSVVDHELLGKNLRNWTNNDQIGTWRPLCLHSRVLGALPMAGTNLCTVERGKIWHRVWTREKVKRSRSGERKVPSLRTRALNCTRNWFDHRMLLCKLYMKGNLSWARQLGEPSLGYCRLGI